MCISSRTRCLYVALPAWTLDLIRSLYNTCRTRAWYSTIYFIHPSPSLLFPMVPFDYWRYPATQSKLPTMRKQAL
ncbi:hypothetical protein CPB85DRAFT_1330381 [Mucidula mucida]|nr:hypothetical protein CPB85DRAFT_1330381 [Mucidula mucida]